MLDAGEWGDRGCKCRYWTRDFLCQERIQDLRAMNAILGKALLQIVREWKTRAEQRWMALVEVGVELARAESE